MDNHEQPLTTNGAWNWLEVFRRIELYASWGMKRTEICSKLGLSLDNWRWHANKGGRGEIEEAFKRGKGEHAAIVFSNLVKNTQGGDTKAAIFLAKAHLGRQEGEIKIDARTLIVSPDQFGKLAKADKIKEIQQLAIDVQNLIESEDE